MAKTAEKPEDDSDAGPEAAAATPAPPAKGGRLRRLLGWPFANWFRTAVVAAATLAWIGGAIVLWLAMSRSEPAESVVNDRAQKVLDALDEGNAEAAKELAEPLREASAGQSGVGAYVLGALAADEADELRGEARRNRNLAAAQWLEEAKARGVPESREGDLLYRLGKALWSARRWAASRAALRDALAAAPQRAAEIHYMLADGLLRDTPPKPAEALQENRTLLGVETLPDASRYRALLQQGEILLSMGKPEACFTLARSIPASSPRSDEARLLQGWARLDEAKSQKQDQQPADKAKLEDAVRLLRQAQARGNPAVAPKAMYLIGLALAESGDSRGAVDQFAQTRTAYFGTPEAAAARFEEAELLRQTGQTAEALAAYADALRVTVDPESYFNPWLPLDALRRRTLIAVQYYFDQRNYQACFDLAGSAQTVLTRARAEQLIGESARAWGQDLLSKAEAASGGQRRNLAQEGRHKLREAGRAFEAVAVANLTARPYIDNLWDSANAYLQGHEYAAAARMFQEYLKNEPQRRQPAALTGLGECRLALGQFDDAMAELTRCIQRFPQDVVSYRARLLAAQVAMAKNDLPAAQAFVEQNIASDGLAPTSREWRQSLYLLCEILFDRKDYPLAIARLGEAVKRYAEQHESLRARYLMADAYWRMAQRETEKLAGDAAATSRRDRAKRINTAQNAALESFRRTHDAILRYQETHELTAADRAMLRNCQFAAADLLLELGRCDEAIQAYAQVAGKHQGTPLALEAYVRIARAWQKLDKPEMAKDALDQCRTALERIPKSAAYNETTNYNRQQWSELLDRLSAM